MFGTYRVLCHHPKFPQARPLYLAIAGSGVREPSCMAGETGYHISRLISRVCGRAVFSPKVADYKRVLDAVFDHVRGV
jgi:hypothetical protein